MPDNSNVVPMVPDATAAIGARIDAAYERAQRGLRKQTEGRAEWIEGSLELAAALLEGRERMGNPAFGAWLRDNHHDHLNATDRAALMNIGRDPSLARAALEASQSISYQIIWGEARYHYPTDMRMIPRNARSTANGPWTAAIDARLTALFHQIGNHPARLAAMITAEFPEAVANRADRMFTPGMVKTALRDRLGLVEQSPSRSRAAPTPATTRPRRAPPREPVVAPAAPSGRILSRQEIDPEFTGTAAEFTMIHGHVRTQTAAQQATAAFGALASKFRTIARQWRDYEATMASSSTPINFSDPYWAGWLREPDARDLLRLTEALEYLRPRIAEAEAALARAEAARAPVAATGPTTGELARAE
ncbi:MAG TPA: hypothetical protein VGR63_19015 [Casimicrobiaceae bacterium]|jgi:hypothetical protein|nr:hypothetical protein [Casimicrobiaceae bacterium]